MAFDTTSAIATGGGLQPSSGESSKKKKNFQPETSTEALMRTAADGRGKNTRLELMRNCRSIEGSAAHFNVPTETPAVGARRPSNGNRLSLVSVTRTLIMAGPNPRFGTPIRTTIGASTWRTFLEFIDVLDSTEGSFHHLGTGAWSTSSSNSFAPTCHLSCS